MPTVRSKPTTSHRAAGAAALAHGAPHEVTIKRTREAPLASDGIRVLVDRLWPRGLPKAELHMDLWLKDVAPSTPLRRWFGHVPERWESFVQQYRAELAQREDLLQLLDDLRGRGRLTLLYDVHDPVHNNAVVLRDVLCERDGLHPPAKGVQP